MTPDNQQGGRGTGLLQAPFPWYGGSTAKTPGMKRTNAVCGVPTAAFRLALGGPATFAPRHNEGGQCSVTICFPVLSEMRTLGKRKEIAGVVVKFVAVNVVHDHTPAKFTVGGLPNHLRQQTPDIRFCRLGPGPTFATAPMSCAHSDSTYGVAKGGGSAVNETTHAISHDSTSIWLNVSYNYTDGKFWFSPACLRGQRLL